MPVDKVVELDLDSGLDSGLAEDLDEEDDLDGGDDLVVDFGLAALSLDLPDEVLLGHERRRR